MLTYDDALASLLSHVPLQDVHHVSLPAAVGEVLARDVTADRDLPPFPRAAMDGYALAWTGGEESETYRVIGTVNPGSSWEGRADPFDCVKIMTGAMVPPPFDTVIQVELSRVEPAGGVRFTGPVKRGANIARQGEDIREGAVVIPAGTLLSPHHVATLSSVGRWELAVYRRPKVAVLATGSELVEPWEIADGPMIRNGNSHFLLAALKDLGISDVRYLGIVPDEMERIVPMVREGIECDFLVISGGVSVGEVDIVPDCLAACGVRKILHNIAVRPGKPIYAGASPHGSIVLGMPGNPVALMVHFSMFLRPLLLRASGARECLPRSIRLPLAKATGNKGGRMRLAIARLDSSNGETRVDEMSSHGSGDFVSIVNADGVFEVPPGTAHLPPGYVVPFHPIWGKFLSDER